VVLDFRKEGFEFRFGMLSRRLRVDAGDLVDRIPVVNENQADPLNHTNQHETCNDRSRLAYLNIAQLNCGMLSLTAFRFIDQ